MKKEIYVTPYTYKGLLKYMPLYIMTSESNDYNECIVGLPLPDGYNIRYFLGVKNMSLYEALDRSGVLLTNLQSLILRQYRDQKDRVQLETGSYGCNSCR